MVADATVDVLRVRMWLEEQRSVELVDVRLQAEHAAWRRVEQRNANSAGTRCYVSDTNPLIWDKLQQGR